jgi:hypothetical protein
LLLFLFLAQPVPVSTIVTFVVSTAPQSARVRGQPRQRNVPFPQPGSAAHANMTTAVLTLVDAQWSAGVDEWVAAARRYVK